MDSKIRLAVQLGIAVLLVVVAATAARGIGNIVSRKVVEMTPYEVVSDNSKTEAIEIPRGDENADVLIYNRNLFNQKSGMEEPEPEPEPVVAEEDTVIEEIVGDGKRPVLTDLRVLLQGTQVASVSQYSVAMLMPLDGGSDARMKYVKEGDTLLDEARILKIVRNRVYMERITQNNRLEYIDTRTTEQDLEESKKALEKAAEKERAAAAAAESAKAAAAAAAAAKDSKKSAKTELVKKVDADTYEVSREAVENIRKNPNSLKNNPQYGALPKVQPVYKNGNIGGFRLLGVESGSIYSQLGLKSGDTIIDVNGQAIEGPQQAMALLDALQPGQNVALKINRSGQEKTLTFQLK